MENEEQKQTIEFYKKRFEIQAKQNLVFKEENAVLRKELNSIKKVVTEIIIPLEKKAPKENSNDNLRQILEFQHSRIEILENENLELQKKYEKILFENEKIENENGFEEKPTKNEGRSKILFAKYSENSEELIKANKTIWMLENKLKELAANYAKEIVDLKTKLTTQSATMIINKKEANSFEGRIHSADSDSKDFLFKRKDNLQPLEKNLMSGHKLQNKSMFEGDNLFNYNKLMNK